MTVRRIILSFRAALALGLAVLTGVEPVLADTGTATLWQERRADFRPAAILPPPMPSSLKGLLRNAPGRLAFDPSGDAAGPTLVLVQDVHLNPEAQKNIRDTVERLVASGRVSFVALEGATGDIDLSIRDRRVDPTIFRNAADYLLATGRISGAVHALLTGPGPRVPVRGVEQARLYAANVAAAVDGRRRLPAAEKTLRELRSDLEREEAGALTPDVVSFLRESRAARAAGGLTPGFANRLLPYASEKATMLRRYIEAAALEAAFDAARLEGERRRLIDQLLPRLTEAERKTLLADAVAFRSGAVSQNELFHRLAALCDRHNLALSRFPALQNHRRYLELASGLDIARLAEEAKDAENNAAEMLAPEPEARALVAADRWLSSAEKLVRFGLTREEWRDYASSARPPRFAGRAPDLRPFENFYRLALARDAALSGEVMRLMRSHPTGVGILVAGGFHTAALSSAARKEMARVVTFTPKLTKDPGEPDAYFSVFTRERTPLDRLLDGERIFLANPPARLGLLPEMEVLGEEHADPSRPLTDPSGRLAELRGSVLRAPIASRDAGPDSAEMTDDRGRLTATFDGGGRFRSLDWDPTPTEADPYPQVERDITIIPPGTGAAPTVNEIYGPLFARAQAWAGNRRFSAAPLYLRRVIDMRQRIIHLQTTEKNEEMPVRVVAGEAARLRRFFPGYRIVVDELMGIGFAKGLLREYDNVRAVRFPVPDGHSGANIPFISLADDIAHAERESTRLGFRSDGYTMGPYRFRYRAEAIVPPARPEDFEFLETFRPLRFLLSHEGNVFQQSCRAFGILAIWGAMLLTPIVIASFVPYDWLSYATVAGGYFQIGTATGLSVVDPERTLTRGQKAWLVLAYAPNVAAHWLYNRLFWFAPLTKSRQPSVRTSRPRATLKHHLSEPDPRLEVSVVVPVLSEFINGNVTTLLENFAEQTADKETFEIILVVNNKKTDLGTIDWLDNQALLDVASFLTGHANALSAFAASHLPAEQRRLLEKIAASGLRIQFLDLSTAGHSKRISGIRNEGIRLAVDRLESVGRPDGFVTNMDADTAVPPDFIDRIRAYGPTRVGVIYAGAQAAYGGGSELLFRTHFAQSARDLRIHLSEHLYAEGTRSAGAPQITARGSVWKETGGFYEQADMGEDMDFTYKIRRRYDIVHDASLTIRPQDRARIRGYEALLRLEMLESIDEGRYREEEAFGKYNGRYPRAEMLSRLLGVTDHDNAGAVRRMFRLLKVPFNHRVWDASFTDEDEGPRPTLRVENYFRRMGWPVYGTALEGIRDFVDHVIAPRSAAEAEWFQNRLALLVRREEKARRALRARVRAALATGEFDARRPSPMSDGGTVALGERWFQARVDEARQLGDDALAALTARYPDWLGPVGRSTHRIETLAVIAFIRFLHAGFHYPRQFPEWSRILRTVHGRRRPALDGVIPIESASDPALMTSGSRIAYMILTGGDPDSAHARLVFAPDHEFVETFRPYRFWRAHLGTRLQQSVRAVGIAAIWLAMLGVPLLIAWLIPVDAARIAVVAVAYFQTGVVFGLALGDSSRRLAPWQKAVLFFPYLSNVAMHTLYNAVIWFAPLTAESTQARVDRELREVTGMLFYPAGGSDWKPFRDLLPRTPKVRTAVYVDHEYADGHPELPYHKEQRARLLLGEQGFAIEEIPGPRPPDRVFVRPASGSPRWRLEFYRGDVVSGWLADILPTGQWKRRGGVGLLHVERPGLGASLSKSPRAAAFHARQIVQVSVGGLLCGYIDPTEPPLLFLSDFYGLLGLEVIGRDATGQLFLKRIDEVGEEKLARVVAVDRLLKELHDAVRYPFAVGWTPAIQNQLGPALQELTALSPAAESVARDRFARSFQTINDTHYGGATIFQLPVRFVGIAFLFALAFMEPSLMATAQFHLAFLVVGTLEMGIAMVPTFGFARRWLERRRAVARLDARARVLVHAARALVSSGHVSDELLQTILADAASREGVARRRQSADDRRRDWAASIADPEFPAAIDRAVRTEGLAGLDQGSARALLERLSGWGLPVDTGAAARAHVVVKISGASDLIRVAEIERRWPGASLVVWADATTAAAIAGRNVRWPVVAHDGELFSGTSLKLRNVAANLPPAFRDDPDNLILVLPTDVTIDDAGLAADSSWRRVRLLLLDEVLGLLRTITIQQRLLIDRVVEHLIVGRQA